MIRSSTQWLISCAALAGISLMSVSNLAVADDLMKDFDSLGGNNVLIERARALNPDSRVEVVQDRIVSRKNRWEFSPELTRVLGGDSYLISNGIGLNVHHHFNHRWSAGLKYTFMDNKLSSEGENLISDTTVTGKAFIPEIDYPKNEWLATVDFYPIYGKLNVFDAGVVHFDVYGLVGAGEVELKSGRKSTWTGGLGMGFWFSQHFTSRVELRYQSYRAQRNLGTTPMDLTTASIQFGYLL